MSILDFLFEGSPPPSVTEYGVTTENLPAWYSDYTQGLISKANAVAAEPFQTYGYPRLSPLDVYQTKAYQQTEDLGGQISPLYQTARGLMEQGGAPGAAAAASPYFGQVQDYTKQFAGADTSALAAPFLQSAEELARQGTTATAGAAQPFLGQAGQLVTGAAAPITGQIQNYMDPYREQVVNRIGELGQRQLTENLLPTLQAQGISAGQFGGTRGAEAMGRALRDTQESTLAAQSQALSQGYGQAAQLAGSDAARQLQAAQAAAGLGTTTAGLQSADLQRAMAAGQQLGTLGTTAAGLESADVARQLAAAQQFGTTGQQLGALTQQDLLRQLQAGTQMGALAGEEQQAALQRIGALEAAGAAKQQDAQRNLDLAYQDFIEQRNYDRGNIAFLNAAIRGLEVPSQVTKEATGPASVYQPSPLSQLAAGFGAYSGLRKVLGTP